MASTQTLEPLFQRFRDRGDAQALAAVFDRAAPQLLLVAAHVTPDPAAAEDLVQDTFLQAMRDAAGWDPHRPLLPWLCGILQHRAVDLARRQRLRGGGAPLDENAIASAAAGPDAEASASDLLARVQQALGELQSPFREALVLRLAHGMTPTEIAHALGRPPATVRVQLLRGLELLRGRLPAGIATALALLLAQERGLAAARATVLAAAGAGAGAALFAGARRLWLALGAATLAVAVGIAAWPRAVATDPSSGTVTVAPTTPPLAATSTDAPPAAVAARTPAHDVSTAAAPTTLRGRLVHARDHRPIAGGSARVTFGPGRFVTADPSFRTWPEPVVASADVDGTFAVAIAPTAAMRIGIEVSAPGFTPADASWPSLKNGIDIDLGDVPLFPGRELRARVVDEQGQPMPGLRIEIRRDSGGTDARDSMFALWSSLELDADAEGRLAAHVVPAPGTYSFAAASRLPGFRVIRPTQIEVADAPVFADVVVARQPAADSLRGHVVDERGNPVAGVTLTVDPVWLDIASATADATGAFWLPLDQVAADEVALALPVVERAFALLEPERKYRSGSADLEVRVRRLPTFDVAVDVVAAADGAPVVDYGLCWDIDYWTEARKFTIPPERIYLPAAATTHAGGRTVLSGLQPGDYRLCVYPRDRALATAYLVPFHVGDTGAAPLRVELAPFAPLRVQLRDDRGAPLPSVQVRLLHTMATGGEAAATFSIEQLAAGIGGGHDMAVALQTATTDAAGTAVLQAPVGEPRIALRLHGPRVRDETRPLDAVPAAGAAIELALPALAVVRGHIDPPAFVQRIGPSAQLRREAAIVREEDAELEWQCPKVVLENTADRPAARGVVWPDGTFAIDTASPGDHDLVLYVDWEMNPGFYTSERFVLAHLDGLRAGETRDLAIDAARFLPARLRGSVRVDGTPWAAGEFGLLTVDPADWRAFRIALDAAGTFDRALQPGRYLPFLEWRDGGDRHLVAGERLDLAAASDGERPFTFERRALAVQVLDQDGKAAAGARLALRLVDFPEAATLFDTEMTADERGALRLDPAPPGRVQLCTPGDDGAVLGEFAAGPAVVTEVAVRLPAPTSGR